MTIMCPHWCHLLRRAILRDVRASLRLVKSSSGLFTISQLLAVNYELRKTLAVIGGQIQAAQSDGRRVVLDTSDWESASDEEKDGKKEETGAAGGSGGGSEHTCIPIPGPYPASPPETDTVPGR